MKKQLPSLLFVALLVLVLMCGFTTAMHGQPRDSLARAQLLTDLALVADPVDSLDIILSYWTVQGSFFREGVDERPSLHRALAIADRLQDEHAAQKVAKYLSHQYYLRMEVDSQYHYALRSWTLAQRIRSDSVLGDAAYMMANVHLSDHRYDSAMHYTTQAIAYYSSENVNRPVSLANAYRKMSTIMGRAYRRGNKESLYYSRKAVEICTDEVDPYFRSQFLVSLAVDFGFMMEHDSVYHYVQILIDRGRRLDQPAILATGLHMLSEYYYFTDRYEEAIRWADTLEQQGHYQHLSYNQYNNNLLNRTEALYKLERYAASLDVAQRLMERAQLHQVGFLMRDLSQHMSLLYEQLGRPQLALDMLRASVTYSDSLFSASQSKTVAELEKKYKTAEKDRDLARVREVQVQQALQFQRRWSLAGILVLLAVLGGAYFFYRSRLQTLRAEKAASELQQRLLRSQMNPHFAYNTLGSIQHYLLQSGESDRAAYYLAKFSKLMRQILDQSRASTIPLTQELETLKNYLSLQQLRYGRTFSFQLAVDPAIDTEQTLVPPMLLQPLIENAIEHGKIHTLDEGQVSVEIKLRDDMLRVEVKDNGLGKTSQTLPKPAHKPASVATSIIKERLAILRKRHGGQIGYDIVYPPNGGTQVSLQLPYLLH